MAKDTIAHGSVLITTNADPMGRGLAGAGRDIDKWGKTAGAKGGKNLSGGIAAGVMAGGPLLAAGLAVAGVGLLAEGFSRLTDEMDKTSKVANTLDMPVENLVGWQHAANLSGVESDALTKSLLFFRKQVEGPLDGALENLMSRYEGTADAGERARILTEAFGRQGAMMAPMFKDGAAGIKSMIDEAKALGITFTKEQGEQVEAANDSITRVKSGMKGMLQTALISIAPVVERIADMGVAFFKFVKPAIDWAIGAWNQYQDLVTLVWEEIAKVAKEAWQWIQETASGLFDWVDELPTAKEVIVMVFRAVGVAAALAWDTIKAGAGAVLIVTGYIVKGFGDVVNAFKEVVSLAENLPDELKPDGMNEFIKAVGEFETAVKGTGDEMIERGKGMAATWGKSAEDFNKWLDKALIKAVKIGKAKVIPDVPDFRTDSLKMSAAIVKGSKEAYSMVVQNQYRELIGEGDTAKKQLKENQKTNKKLDKGNDELGKIAEKLEGLTEF